MAIEYKLQITDSLTKQIAESIRSAILDGRLEVDERLPTEDELAQRFGVSRPTVREALKRLAAQNLVRSRRGPSGGTFVSKPSLETQISSLASAMAVMATVGEIDLSDIAEARHQLEQICCRFAAERREEFHLAAMKEELEIQRNQTLSDVDFCASDVRFHRVMADATRNPILQSITIAVLQSLQPISNLVIWRFCERSLIVEQHERLYQAVAAQNGDAAVEVWNEQVSYLRTKYTEAQEWRRRQDQSGL